MMTRKLIGWYFALLASVYIGIAVATNGTQYNSCIALVDTTMSLQYLHNDEEVFVELLEHKKWPTILDDTLFSLRGGGVTL